MRKLICLLEQQELLTKEIGSLYGQYETRFYYWECIEMIKKMMLTGGLVLLAPGSSAQILLGILITLVYLCLVFKVELIVILTLQYKYYYVMIMNSKGRLGSDQHIIMIRPLVLLFTHNADDY